MAGLESKPFLHLPRQVARWEPWLVLAVAPLLLFPGWWTAVGLGLMTLSWACRRLATGRWAIPEPANVPLVLMVVLMVGGFIPSVHKAASLAGLWRVVLGAALYFALANGLRERGQMQRWTWLLLALGPALACLALLGTRWGAVRLLSLPALYGRIPALREGLARGDSFNPRVVGMALGTLVPLPLALFLFGSRRPPRLFCAIVALTTGVVLLLTQSLQALLGVGAALLLLLACKSRWWLLTVPAGLSVLGGALPAYGRRVAQVALSPENAIGIGVTLRLDMWARALAMIRDTPFTGIGINTFPQVQSAFYPGYLLGPEPHAHNLFLQVALDGGLWALAALMWFLVALALSAVRGYHRCSDRQGRVLILGLGAGVLSFVVSGCVDTLWTSKPVVLFWLMAGTLVAAANFAQGEETRSPARGFPQLGEAIAGALWVGSLLLSLALAPGLRDLNWGRIAAHPPLLMARTTGSVSPRMLQAAAVRIERARVRRLDTPYTLDLLGSLYAWLGQDDLALQALAGRVALDAPDPMARYAPFEAWRRRIVGEPGARIGDDALRIYDNWLTRFPERAEIYVQEAIVWQQYRGDPERALAVLKEGLDRGAQPQGLLLHAQARLQQGALP